MGNIENAFIQQNNIRWINQKAMEGVNRPKPEPKPTIEIKYTSLDGGRKLSSYSIMVEQALSRFTQVTEGIVTVRSVRSVNNLDAFRMIANSLRNHTPTHSDCYSCKYFSGDQLLKCAVNPARTIDLDCDDFERASNFVGSDWDSSENNPANYQEY